MENKVSHTVSHRTRGVLLCGPPQREKRDTAGDGGRGHALRQAGNLREKRRTAPGGTLDPRNDEASGGKKNGTMANNQRSHMGMDTDNWNNHMDLPKSIPNLMDTSNYRHYIDSLQNTKKSHLKREENYKTQYKNQHKRPTR